MMPIRITHPEEIEIVTPEDRLREGLLNFWYLIARAEDVTTKPVALTRLGRKIVLWRDAGGVVQAVDDYCLHRGAPLSLGTICDGFITCPYHGLQFDGNGVVRATPPTPNSPLVEGKFAVRSYPCREFSGAIWVYFGVDDEAEPPKPCYPEELESTDWSEFLFTAEWDCNWQITLDNRLDPIHGSFLHDDSYTLSRGKKEAELEVTPTNRGFETRRTNQSGVNIDWHEVEYHPENMFFIRADIPYPIKVGGGFIRVIGHPTPIDANRTLIWFFRCTKASGWKRDLWRFLYKNRFEQRHLYVVEQDRIMLEAFPGSENNSEKLLQTDIAIARMRKMLREEATRQVNSN